MIAALSLLPTLKLIRLIALGVPLWLMALLLPGGWLAGLAYLVLLAALCWRDVNTIPRASELSARRELPPRFALGTDQSLTLVLHNRTALPLLAAVGDTVKVYPNFRGADQYPLLAKTDRQEESARRPRPFKAAGTDFESLRPYIAGEDPRNIDWKATARRGALISRNRQVEKGQQLAVLLDAGRLMAETIGEYSRLEHAINATVMLSYVAQKRGDALAVAAFSNQLESFLPPVRGPALLGRVLESLYAVEARPVESDYWQVIARLMALLRRRSLVILLTDVLDATASAGLIHNLARAAERHVVLCVVLPEPLIGATAHSVPATVEETYRKAAACDQVRRRSLALENMRSRGILVLETGPAHLSVHLVQRYLEIRQADLQ